jgi:hypothetical protein
VSYTTKVSTSVAGELTIGHTLPADAEVQAVILDGEQVAVEDYDVVDSTRGREVSVEISTGGPHELVVTTSYSCTALAEGCLPGHPLHRNHPSQRRTELVVAVEAWPPAWS